MLSEKRKEDWTIRLVYVLGGEKIGALSERQAVHLNNAFRRLIEGKSMNQNGDMEILGHYDLTVNHTSPLAYEVLKKPAV